MADVDCNNSFTLYRYDHDRPRWWIQMWEGDDHVSTSDIHQVEGVYWNSSGHLSIKYPYNINRIELTWYDAFTRVEDRQFYTIEHV